PVECGNKVSVRLTHPDGPVIRIKCGHCSCWDWVCGKCRCACGTICVIGEVDGELIPNTALHWDGGGWSGETGYGTILSVGIERTPAGGCRVTGSGGVSTEPGEDIACGEFFSCVADNVDGNGELGPYESFNWLMGS